MKKGLTSLIAPKTHTEFLQAYAKNEPFVIHHPNGFDEFEDLPFLASLETLLKTWPGTIQAHLPDLRDEVSSIDTQSKDALKLFNNGMGLLFNEAQELSNVLKECDVAGLTQSSF